MKLFNRVSRRIRSRDRKRPAFHLNFELCEERLLLTPFTVNSILDTDPGGMSNTGTLRHVINRLNASGTATNTIDFQIGSVGTLATITLTSDLPPITRQVTINGYSQGGPTNAVILIQLNLNGHNGLLGNGLVLGLCYRAYRLAEPARPAARFRGCRSSTSRAVPESICNQT